MFTTTTYADNIFETARDPLLLLDENLYIRAANRAFCNTFRLTPNEVLGQSLLEIGNSHWNVPRFREFLERLLPQKGSLFDFELINEFEHVGQRILLINGRRVVPTMGPGQGICLSIQDVTEQRQAQAAMQRLHDELEERVQQRTADLETSNRELEAFSYSVSHDLRSPLRALDGYARILAEEHGTAMPTEALEFVLDIRRNAQKMGHLIDDLLSFSRLSRQGLEKRPVSMSALVRQALQDFHAEQEARSVEVFVGDLPSCQADPALLKQVWLNLLSNAFKYTRKTPLPRIEIGSREEQGERIYFVRDNGAGFDMKYAGKLFGVFQRLHKPTEFDGTGVGLAIVQRIVHRHGGRVWADAAVQQGATFSFTLPAGGNNK